MKIKLLALISVPVLVAALLVPGQTNAAGITPIYNGNFELQTGSGESQTVSGWFESSTSTDYNDWVRLGTTTDAGQFPAGQTNIVNFSNPNGYIYQSIGAYAGEPAIDVSGKAIRRYPGAVRAFRPFSISVYQTPTNVAGAIGVHPSALTGALLVSSVSVSDTELGLTGSYSAPQMTNFTRTLPLTGTTTNAKVWLVFGALSGNNETALDDLALAINTNYVPPVPVPVEYATMQVISNGDSAAVIAEKAAKVLPRANQSAWMRLERTFFVHFGVNTFNGVEWGTGHEDPSIFNPTSLDANQWIGAMKNEGGKLVILVCKHHDGFCMWPTRYTPHSVASSPWLGGAGDEVGAVASAAQAQGLKLGVYVSPADLYQLRTNTNNPAGYYGDGSSNVLSVIPTDPANFKANPMAGRTPPTGFTNYTYVVDDYNRYFLNQLYELLTQYGPIADVWFDGANPDPSVSETYNYAAWYDLIHQLQPDAVISVKGPDVRWVGNEGGVGRTTEWSVIPLSSSPDTFTWPDMQAGDLGSRALLTPGSYLWWYPAEVNAPILNGWFWSADKTPKSASQLIDIYYQAVGRNGNMLLNLSPDTRGLIPDNQLAPLSQMAEAINDTFATNLAVGGTLAADTSNSTNSPSLALDGSLDTWWEAAPGQTNATLTLTLPTALTFDVVSLQEAVDYRGQRIESWAIDTWSGSAWTPVTNVWDASNLTTVGHRRLARLTSPLTTSQVRIRILGSRLEPTLAEVGLFKQAAVLSPPAISDLGANGLVTLGNANGYTMFYTITGATPTTNSTVYTSPIALPLGGTVQGICLSPQGQVSLVASRSFAGLAPMGWTVAAVDSQETTQENDAGANAIDGNPSSIWHTQWNADLALPHYITIDMGTSRWIGGFTYLPRQDGNPNGVVQNYRFETSSNGLNWTTNVVAGAFGNIKNNPALQEVPFTPVKARFFRFTALQEVNTNGWTSAAEISVLPAGFDAWRRDLGLQTNGILSDPAGEGIPLLLDYFRGVAPGNASHEGASLLTADAVTNGLFQFSLRRQPGLVDVWQSCQVSTNLLSWSPALGVVTNGITSEADGSETVHLSVPRSAGAAPMFLRLVIGQN